MSSTLFHHVTRNANDVGRVQKSWYPRIPGHCIDKHAYDYGSQIPKIITDFLLLLLPLRPISKLSLSVKEMTLLFLLFGVGLLSCILDIVRLKALLDAFGTLDITWTQTSVAIWTDIEPSIGILAACLPSMAPLFRLPQVLNRRAGREQRSVSTITDEPVELRPRKSNERSSQREASPDIRQ